MSSAVPWLAVAVFALILVFLVVFLIRKEKKETDYRTLFRMGLIWLAIGLFMEARGIVYFGEGFELNSLIVLGFIFTVSGYANKSKWKECDIK